MRKIVLASVAIGAVAAVGLTLTPEAAMARDYPFCFKGEHFIAPVGDCSYDTYEQCKATAFGLRGYCDVNPYYAYPEARIVSPRRPSRGY